MCGMSGMFERLAGMTNIIDHSRKQKSITITLVDLKNTFGEVHHSLIQTDRRYHHILDEINNILKMLYGDLSFKYNT